MRYQELFEARPKELGAAYFFFEGALVDIDPYRNHSEWLVAHMDELELPGYIQNKPSKALFEAYKIGIIRIVWDEGGKWQYGRASKGDNVLYINGIEKTIWRNLAKIMNQQQWAGMIDTLVIEYLDIVAGKPKWDRFDMYRQAQIGWRGFEDLYKGRKPRKGLAPLGAKVPPGVEESNILEGILSSYGIKKMLVELDSKDVLKYNKENPIIMIRRGIDPTIKDQEFWKKLKNKGSMSNGFSRSRN